MNPVLHDILASLRESFLMFWATLWALILGFGLSGAVQAFAPREALRAKLGNHGPAAVGRASLFGALSSSCSYAATAMAKSLFAKGADFVTAMIFMFASTNLVLELGLVLIVLIGWQFAAAEYVGGAIMIVALALLGGLFLAGRRVAAARARLNEADAADQHGAHHAVHQADPSAAHQASPHADQHAMPPADPHYADPQAAHSAHPHAAHQAELSPRAPIRTRKGWSEAANYTMADLTMLRRELLIGFLAAGFLAVLVPVSFWQSFFITGHGAWTSIENAIVGPFIALISFVCSIGNVPLAAALWHGGISFGGVISFIFADLIALPLVLIYRKFYGGALALRMLAVFWAVMSTAGLLTQLIFEAAGLVPTHRPVQIVPDRLTWNYTTVLNIVFLVVFAILYWLRRRGRKDDMGAGYATDPVCGMTIETAIASARGHGHYFCSDHCRERFENDPAKFATASRLWANRARSTHRLTDRPTRPVALTGGTGWWRQSRPR